MSEQRSQDNWAFGCNDNREDEHDGAEPDVDEPSLGSVATSPHVSQQHWSQGEGEICDAEQEHDGREPDGRNNSDISEAKARNSKRFDHMYRDGKIAASEALHDLKEITQRAAYRNPKKKTK